MSLDQSDIEIRCENAGDYDYIFTIHSYAFKKDGERKLVSALRELSVFDPNLSLVAVIKGQLVGHILFTPVEIVSNAETVTAIALGPIGWTPRFSPLSMRQSP